MAKIDSIYDFSDKALVEIKSWLEPWFPRGPASDCNACDSGLPSTDEVIRGLGVDGFWKLDESSGTVAHDSSGGGYNMSPGSYSPPTWGDATTTFGTSAARFGTGLGESVSSFPSLTGDLTMAIFAKKVVSGSTGLMIGQGDPTGSSNPGAAMLWGNSGVGFLAIVHIGDAGGPHAISSNAALTAGQWYSIICRRQTHVWTLFIDAVQQTSTYDDTGTHYSATTGAWIGNPPPFDRAFDGDLAYGAIFAHALTNAEIKSISDSGITVNITGDYVWTADGSGGASWERPTVGASGTTGTRPTVTVVGTGYWDTTLGKPIWWNGTVWKDATGTTV